MPAIASSLLMMLKGLLWKMLSNRTILTGTINATMLTPSRVNIKFISYDLYYIDFTILKEMKMITLLFPLSGPETLASSKTFGVPMSCSAAARKPCISAATGISSLVAEVLSHW